MEDEDNKKKPEDLQTDPTVATDSNDVASVIKSINSKRPEQTPGDQAQDAPEDSSGGSRSFRAPRKHTVDIRTSRREQSQAGSFINDRYRIEKEIARGGMGRVYMATQLPLGRPVAIKVLRSEFSDGDPKFPQRFFLEASISSQLVHPNIITIHDYGETDDGDLFMAMEFLDGISLSRHIKRHAPLPEELSLHIALQIARAVRVAHKRNVIHRDLKPGNVMVVPRGEDKHFIKVLDFGLVKMLETTNHSPQPEPQELDPDDENHPVNLTKAGVLLGSPRYMSPEQIRGEVLDPRTDIYSLGIILYQMITGRAPFLGKTSIDVIYQHIHNEVPFIEDVPCSDQLEKITRRCLIKDRSQRYSTMTEVIDELKAVQEQIFGKSYGGSDNHSLIEQRLASSTRPGTESKETSPSTSSIAHDLTESRAHDHKIQSTPFQEPGFVTGQEDTPSNSAQFVKAATNESQTPLFLGIAGLLVAIAALCALLLTRTDSEIKTVPKLTPTSTEQSVKSTTPPKAELSTVRFSSEPEGASVFFDGQAVGVTPTDIRVPQTKSNIPVEMKLEGFEDWKIERDFLLPKINIQSKLTPQKQMPAPVKPRIKKRPVKAVTKPKKKDSATKSQTRPTKTKPVESDSKKKPKSYRNNPY